MSKVAKVVLDSHLDRPLDYAIPKQMQTQIRIGMRVQVPLKSSLQKGFVLALENTSDFPSLKPIESLIEENMLTNDLMTLGVWMARYYVCSLSKAFSTMIPTSIRHEIHPKEQLFISLAVSKQKIANHYAEIHQKSEAQAKVLQLLLKSRKGLFLQQIMHKLDVSSSPIKTLVKHKLLKETKITADSAAYLYNHPYFPTKPKSLNDEQQSALNKIKDSVEKNQNDIHLLYGITGSGKTEVFLQAIDYALKKNKTVLILVPEVALTSQTVERLKTRFSEPIALIHHKKSLGERFELWHKIKNKKIKIVIGARSAIFSPMIDLGLIIIDEEHDSSYKQTDEMPCYHVRHIAQMRAKLFHCPILLASATPSMESYYRAINNQYILSTLTKRATNAPLANVKIIDMKFERQKMSHFSYFSQELLDKIEDRYKKGEQTLLFLNRRGTHHFLICLSCSHVIHCPHCAISLTYHKNKNLLICHGCQFSSLPPKTCPSCNKQEYLQYKGFGTEHVERSLHAIFPHIRTLRMDRDTTTEKHAHETLLKEFRSGKADVLIGTQMIVKGLHFPSVTLVGVLNTDGALNIPDFRASENVFQLLTQVAGRAGREELLGEVLIQTYMPQNDTIQKAKTQDYLGFYQEEIKIRESFFYPPFSHIIKFLFTSEDEKLLNKTAHEFRDKLVTKLPSQCQIHPLMEANPAKIKDRYRKIILLRTPNILETTKIIGDLKKVFLIPRTTHLLIDVNPIYTS